MQRDKRRLGIAKKLTLECEKLAKDWGYNELYLLVDSENMNAINFYKKLSKYLYTYKILLKYQQA